MERLAAGASGAAGDASDVSAGIGATGAATGVEGLATGAGSAGCVATKGGGELRSGEEETGEETLLGAATTLSFGADGTPTALTVSPDETPDSEVAVAGCARQSPSAKEPSARKDDVF